MSRPKGAMSASTMHKESLKQMEEIATKHVSPTQPPKDKSISNKINKPTSKIDKSDITTLISIFVNNSDFTIKTVNDTAIEIISNITERVYYIK